MVRDTLKCYSFTKGGVFFCLQCSPTQYSMIAKETASKAFYESAKIDVSPEEKKFLEKAAERIKSRQTELIEVFKDKSIEIGISGLKTIKLNPSNAEEPEHLEQEIQMEELKQQNFKLEVENKLLKLNKEQGTMKPQGVLNQTIFVDNARRPYATNTKHVYSCVVDKKHPNSILFIQANLSVHGQYNAETCQIWTFGGTTIAYGQSENYSNNNGYTRPVPGFAVISGHTATGPQELSLSFKGNLLPFTVINPNKSDHADFADCQTTSVYSITELMPN